MLLGNMQKLLKSLRIASLLAVLMLTGFTMLMLLGLVLIVKFVTMFVSGTAAFVISLILFLLFFGIFLNVLFDNY
jgi:hypothetical protein